MSMRGESDLHCEEHDVDMVFQGEHVVTIGPVGRPVEIECWYFECPDGGWHTGEYGVAFAKTHWNQDGSPKDPFPAESPYELWQQEESRP